MKFATFKSNGKSHYGAIHDAGIAALDPLFPEWPTLFDAVKNNGLSTLKDAAEEAKSAIRALNMTWFSPTYDRFYAWV